MRNDRSTLKPLGRFRPGMQVEQHCSVAARRDHANRRVGGRHGRNRKFLQHGAGRGVQEAPGHRHGQLQRHERLGPRRLDVTDEALRRLKTECAEHPSRRPQHATVGRAIHEAEPRPAWRGRQRFACSSLRRSDPVQPGPSIHDLQQEVPSPLQSSQPLQQANRIRIRSQVYDDVPDAELLKPRHRRDRRKLPRHPDRPVEVRRREATEAVHERAPMRGGRQQVLCVPVKLAELVDWKLEDGARPGRFPQPVVDASRIVEPGIRKRSVEALHGSQRDQGESDEGSTVRRRRPGTSAQPDAGQHRHREYQENSETMNRAEPLERGDRLVRPDVEWRKRAEGEHHTDAADRQQHPARPPRCGPAPAAKGDTGQRECETAGKERARCSVVVSLAPGPVVHIRSRRQIAAQRGGY